MFISIAFASLSVTVIGAFQAKVRARLSRPLQRGKGKHVSRGDFRSGHGAGRAVRGPWVRPVPRSFPTRAVRGIGGRGPPASVKRPVGLRDRRPPVMSMPARGRPLAPPSRSYERRAPGMHQSLRVFSWLLLLAVRVLEQYFTPLFFS